MGPDYGWLFVFFSGVATGCALDWFRRWLNTWAERQEAEPEIVYEYRRLEGDRG